MADPSWKEEKCMESKLTLTVNTHGEVCAVQKGGGVGIRAPELLRCLRITQNRVSDMAAKLKSEVCFFVSFLFPYFFEWSIFEEEDDYGVIFGLTFFLGVVGSFGQVENLERQKQEKKIKRFSSLEGKTDQVLNVPLEENQISTEREEGAVEKAMDVDLEIEKMEENEKIVDEELDEESEEDEENMIFTGKKCSW